MSFYKKYELSRLVAEDDAKTFRAREKETGREVYLHLFGPSSSALFAVLKTKLLDRSGRPLPPLVEVGEFAGAPYAVTAVIEPFANLSAWMAGLADAPAKTEEPAPQEPEPAPPQSPPQPEMGEFTRMILGLGKDHQIPDRGAGGFACPPREQPKPPASPVPDAELQRFLEASLPGTAIDIKEAQAKAAATTFPAARPFQPAGEFTRMFGKPEAGEPAPAPKVKLGLHSAKSGLFGMSGESGELTSGPAAAAAGIGSGEYTRIIGEPAPEAATAPSKSSAPAAVPAPKSNVRTLWIVAGAMMLIILLAVLVYLLLRQ